MLLVALRSYRIRICTLKANLVDVLGVHRHASVSQDEASQRANNFVVFSRSDKRHCKPDYSG